jgi:hypothetical protein
MLSYKYYLNTVTRTVSKHTATVPPCYHIYIYILLYKDTRNVIKHTARVLSCYYIDINAKESQAP